MKPTKPEFWNRAKPGKAKASKPLAENQRQAARARADAAGRRYPNLVDNAWAKRFVPALPAPTQSDDADAEE